MLLLFAVATSSDVSTELEFMGLIRKAIKSAKNKFHKSNCLKRKKIVNIIEDEDEDEGTDSD